MDFDFAMKFVYGIEILESMACIAKNKNNLCVEKKY